MVSERDANERRARAFERGAVNMQRERDELGAKLDAANALLDRIQEHTLKYGFTTRDWFVGVFSTRNAAPDEGCECPGAHECGVTGSTATNERKALGLRDFPASEYLFPRTSAAPEPVLPTASGEYEQGYAAGWLQGQRDAPSAAAKALLALASDAIDEACYPEWWTQYRAYLDRKDALAERDQARAERPRWASRAGCNAGGEELLKANLDVANTLLVRWLWAECLPSDGSLLRETREHLAGWASRAGCNAGGEELLKANLDVANTLLVRWLWAECLPSDGSLLRETREHLAGTSAGGAVLRDGTWIRTPEEERAGTSAAPEDGACRCGAVPAAPVMLCSTCRDELEAKP